MFNIFKVLKPKDKDPKQMLKKPGTPKSGIPKVPKMPKMPK